MIIDWWLAINRLGPLSDEWPLLQWAGRPSYSLQSLQAACLNVTREGLAPGSPFNIAALAYQKVALVYSSEGSAPHSGWAFYPDLLL